MAKLSWYTVKFSLTGIREFEFPQALPNFEEVLNGYPNIRNVIVSAAENNIILIQIGIEDLADLTDIKVAENATEQMLEAVSAVLIEPWDVTVNVIEVNDSD
jgi:hypothetical protein